MVLLGSHGIVQSSEMFVMQEIASALIAGVRGYSDCGGLEKVVGKIEKLKTCLDRCISNHAIYGDFSTISISSSVSPYKS